jgi:hypothetical protein
LTAWLLFPEDTESAGQYNALLEINADGAAARIGGPPARGRA